MSNRYVDLSAASRDVTRLVDAVQLFKPRETSPMLLVIAALNPGRAAAAVDEFLDAVRRTTDDFQYEWEHPEKGLRLTWRRICEEYILEWGVDREADLYLVLLAVASRQTTSVEAVRHIMKWFKCTTDPVIPLPFTAPRGSQVLQCLAKHLKESEWQNARAARDEEVVNDSAESDQDIHRSVMAQNIALLAVDGPRKKREIEPVDPAAHTSNDNYHGVADDGELHYVPDSPESDPEEVPKKKRARTSPMPTLPITPPAAEAAASAKLE